MFSLISTILIASLVGSTHCAGMCGGFVAFYAGSDHTARGFAKSFPHMAYHGGRGLTYMLLGAIAGGVGGALDLAGNLAGVQRVAAVLAGGVMVIWGAIALARALGVKLPLAPVPQAILKTYGAVMLKLRGKPPTLRAGLLGLASALLPCGWLYAFVVTAAGTGNAGYGALAMAVFWLGTVPLLVGLGVGVQQLAGPLRVHLPKLSALALVVVGLLAVTHRASLPQVPKSPRPAVQGLQGAEDQLDKIQKGEEGSCCHGKHADPADSGAHGE
jgi:sulfite exporter TauE/SafE